MKFDHFSIVVRDIARMATFYELLGFVRTEPEVYEMDTPWIKTLMGLDDAVVLTAAMSLDSVTLEFLQYGAPVSSAEIEFIHRGAAHVGIAVDDLDQIYEHLTGLGVPSRSAPITVPDGPHVGTRAVFMVDPEGNLVELIQWPGGS